MTIPIEGYAFLDAIAVGESGGDYTVLYGGGHFHDFSHFPQWGGKDNSHAAGKYQFEPATWKEQAAKLHLKDFTPASQDLAAWDLAQTVYDRRTTVKLIDDLRGEDAEGPYDSGPFFDDIVFALQSTWTSINAKFEARYKEALAKRKSK